MEYLEISRYVAARTRPSSLSPTAIAGNPVGDYPSIVPLKVNADPPFRAPTPPDDDALPAEGRDAPPHARPRGSDLGLPSLREVVARHRRISALVIATVTLLVALTAVSAVSKPSRAPLTDASTCSTWTSADRRQQTAYAERYIQEYPASRIAGLGQAGVQSLISRDCRRAAYLAESDDISVVAALAHAF